MGKHIVIYFVFLFLAGNAYSQDDTVRVNVQDTLITPDTSVVLTENNTTKELVYKLKPAVDIPIIAAGTAWSLYAFTKIYSKEPSSVEKILSLKTSDINAFDRWAVRPFSKKIDSISYYPFFASMPLPFIFLIDKKTRKDFFRIGYLYWEAMAITGLLYTGSIYFTNRYRPYAYSSESTMDQRTRGGAKNSFYGGHIALVATSSFFVAKVYDDYHPGSKLKWVLYGIAAASTGAMSYMRYKAGQHFPSDILIGITQGTLTGVLVPHFHKNKTIENARLNFLPFTSPGSTGFTMIYKL